MHPDGNGGVSLQIFMNEDCKDTVPWASRQTSCQRTGIITGMKHRNIGQVKPVVGGRLRTALTLGAVQADSWAQAWVTAIRVQPGRVIPARSCPNQRNQPLFFFFFSNSSPCVLQNAYLYPQSSCKQYSAFTSLLPLSARSGHDLAVVSLTLGTRPPITSWHCAQRDAGPVSVLR